MQGTCKKLIFSFDLGTNSCGWSVIQKGKELKIVDAGVRIVPSDPNFHGEFEKGNPASKSAARTEKRGIRRNNQRWKQRRDNLEIILKKQNLYPAEKLISLDRFSLYQLRAKSASEQVSLSELGRILLHIIQRRGFLSNRKSQSEEESSSAYKQAIADNTNALDDKTIGQYLFSLIEEKPYEQIRDKVFNRADYRKEVDVIWEEQRKHYPEVLKGSPSNPEGLYNDIVNRILFYQRPLKSVKHLVGKCTFEKNLRATPKSSPLFQSFNMLQKVNSVTVSAKGSRTSRQLTEIEREKLLDALMDYKQLNKYGKLAKTKAIKAIGLNKNAFKINFEELDGDSTYTRIHEALVDAGVDKYEKYLVYSLNEDNPLFRIWHILYSETEEDTVIRLLEQKEGLSNRAAIELAKIGFKSEYGSLSAKAIKKLMPHLSEGLMYNEACDEVGYDHSGYKSVVEIKKELALLKSGTLRNPVVEQMLNQMINITNALINKYGQPSEIKVELARSLRNSAKARKKMDKANRDAKKANEKRRTKLQDEFGYKIVNGRDVKRIRLWEDTDHICLYCGKTIQQTELINGSAEIEHILPKSRAADDSLSNKILSHYRCNKEKSNQTGYDYVASKGSERLEGYIQHVEELYAKKKINYLKYKNLLCTGDDIPTDFLNRQRQDTSYIVREATKILRTIAPLVTTVPGTLTNYLRREWKLDRILEELNHPKYKEAGLIEERAIKTSDGGSKMIPYVKDWSKREDQRHHALDAIIVGLVDRKMIFAMNNLNKLYLDEKGKLSYAQREKMKADFEQTTGLLYSDGLNDYTKRKDITINPPLSDINYQVTSALKKILVSFKKTKSKAVSYRKNKVKGSAREQVTIVPRGPLHEETIVGRTRIEKIVPVNAKLTIAIAEQIVNESIKEKVLSKLQGVEGDSKSAFAKNKYDKDPIFHKGEELREVVIWDYRFTKRVKVDANLNKNKILNIVDDRIRSLLQDYVNSRGGDPAKALKEYDQYPIYTDKDKQHKLKKVKIFADGNYTATRAIGRKNNERPNDFATLGNNHHALVYKNEEGKYSNTLVSMWGAVANADVSFKSNKSSKSVINRSDTEKGKFQFSLQINDLVLLDIPEEDRDSVIELDRSYLSSRLFRVQKMTSAGKSLDVFYRHHLETRVDKTTKDLKGITWERITSDQQMNRLLKVRINNIGELIPLHI